MEELAAGGAAFLTVYAPNPDLLKDISPDRIAIANKTQAIALQKYRSYLMADKAAWSMLLCQQKNGLRKCIRICRSEEAMQELWKVIFEVTRVSCSRSDSSLERAYAKLAATSAYLNKKQYKKLVYEAPGTNLTWSLRKIIFGMAVHR